MKSFPSMSLMVFIFLKIVLLLIGYMATLRNLKIKTSTCKRLVKEFHSYEKEVEREAAKTADMKEKGADRYDLKQQVWSRLVTDSIIKLVLYVSLYHLLGPVPDTIIVSVLQTFDLLKRTNGKVSVN